MLRKNVIFPKTAAGPGASEKPGARLERLLAPLGRVLSPPDRLSGSLEAPLGASWGGFGSLLGPLGALLEASWGLLGASWTLLGHLGGDPKQDKNKDQFSTPKNTPKNLGPTFFWAHVGAQNRPTWHPKRVQI